MNEKEKLEEQEELDEITSEEEEAKASNEDEFEYDEEGNIIIPDVSEEEEDLPQEESEKEPENESETPKETPEEVEQSRELEELKKRYAALEKQSKETLKKLGVESEDAMEGLEKVAAESEDVTLEDYRKKKAESERNDEAVKLLQRTEFEKKMRADLDEVQKLYPETKGVKSITEIENFAEFGRLRDLGLTPEQAYAAANPKSVKQNVAAAVKQQSLNETKAHLKSAVPVGSKDNSLMPSKREMEELRELFPKMSDKELVALHKAVKK